MLNLVGRVMKLAGEYRPRLIWAFVFNFFETIFAHVPIFSVLFALMRIVEGTITAGDAWLFGVAVCASVLLRAIFKRLVDGFQSSTGYEIFARERMIIGDRLKRFPMGYFSEGNIGNITAVVTSDLVFVEEHSMSTLSKIITAYLNTAIGVIFMTIMDYRIGIITVVTVAAAALLLKGLEKVVQRQSSVRQETQARLIGTVLEYVKGIAVIKSFNMTGERAEKTNREFRSYRDTCIEFEEKLISPILHFDSCFAFGIGLTVLTVSYLAFNQAIGLSFLLTLLIFVFQFYLPFKSLSGLSPQIRIMEAALKRYDDINLVPIIDEKSKDVTINRFDIEFNNVGFAYEEKPILHDISFKTPERSMTALVGKSGSGKTTIANLVARFWDVQQGEVKIGGVNVKEMTCDSLLQNVSMVFQNVYLFTGTILSNIKFGKPDATMEEVAEACKKARCHDFIMELEQGYDTPVGEGGATLSGGEKQRISIARAILKDAPIVILDEATASVDPDNEWHIQMAISELVKNKTLIVIAHRLSTIRNADQILVIDEGRIAERGTHEKLMQESGLYASLWERRVKSRSWKIGTAADA